MKNRPTFGLKLLFVLTILVAGVTWCLLPSPLHALSAKGAEFLPVGYNSRSNFYPTSEVTRVGDVESVSLDVDIVGDSQFGLLARFPNLKKLELKGKTRKRHLEFIARRLKVEELTLWTRLTEDQLAVIGRMPHIKTLVLGTNETDLFALSRFESEYKIRVVLSVERKLGSVGDRLHILDKSIGKERKRHFQSPQFLIGM